MDYVSKNQQLNQNIKVVTVCAVVFLTLFCFTKSLTRKTHINMNIW